MKREIGSPVSGIWLLGDSNPINWDKQLGAPFDPRHPARHSIWTSVLDVIQDRLYRDSARLRLDSSVLFIRNAVANASDKPRPGDSRWSERVAAEIRSYTQLVQEACRPDGARPWLILTFGAFAFEFARRALEADLPGFGERPYRYWGAKRLGEEFGERIDGVSGTAEAAVLPLLHVSIARGRFLESHRDFCGDPNANYFDYVGGELARCILRHKNQLGHLFVR